MARVACVQLAPVLGDVRANLAASTAAIADAVSAGAQTVVLTELVTSGYMFTDAEEARSSALAATDPAFEGWIAAAGDAVVVAGFCEAGGDGLLYNSAMVIDRSQVVAVYRKTHLWDREKLIFTPGDRLPDVLSTSQGKLAVLVCYDLEFPELTRLVAVRGAELIAAPVNWPQLPHPDGERQGEVITAMSAARTNRVAIAVCDRTGVERGQHWAESTVVITADGWVDAEVGPGPGMAIADIDLAASRDKNLTEYVHVHADRRLDLY